MQFTQLTLVVNSVNVVFTPYDRGTDGAFVYRKDGTALQSPRLVIKTSVDDNTSDKYQIQNNTPRVLVSEEGSSTAQSMLGTDLVKTELRFLATTSESDRKAAIDLHIAALQKFRSTFEKREKLYS